MLSVCKLLITGTGRAGTTFLVQLLTELGVDTSFPKGDAGPKYYVECKAGLEYNILKEPNRAYVCKNPNLSIQIPEVLRAGIKIDHVLVPIRDLEQAALSREANGKGAGGLLEGKEDQLPVLVDRISTLFNDLAEYEIPFTLIKYPKMVFDPEYLWRRLYRAVPRWIPAYSKFLAVHQKVAKPEYVHHYHRTTNTEEDHVSIE